MTNKKIIIPLTIIVILTLFLCLNTAKSHTSSHDANNNSDNIEMPTIMNSFPEVPKNFNPLTATQKELKKYGFPPRPVNINNKKPLTASQKKALDAWYSIMLNAKHYVKPEQVPSKAQH